MKKRDTSRKSQTDWKRLKAMRDEDIDLSDSPELMPEMFARAVVRRGLKPVTRKSQSIVSKIRGGVSLTGPGLSRKMWGRKIRPRRLSAIFCPAFFCCPQFLRRYSQITLRIDGDVLEWSRKQGQGYQTLINSLLRAYMEAHK
jgi:hypothetical protein